MFFLFCTAVIAVSVLLLGGDLSRLGRVRVRMLWLPIADLGAQLVVTLTIARHLPHAVDAGIHVATYVVLAVFLVVNRKVPGLPLLGLGVISNGVTIALNGGTLPARASALRAAGIVPKEHFTNSGTLVHPVLPWLGDFFATPSVLPFRNVMSVGDLMIMAGVAWLVYATCGTRWSRRPPVEVPAPRGAGDDTSADQPIAATRAD